MNTVHSQEWDLPENLRRKCSTNHKTCLISCAYMQHPVILCQLQLLQIVIHCTAGSIEEQFERSAQYILGVLKVTMTDRRTGKEQFTYSAEASSQQELARKMNKGSCDVMAHFRRLTT